MKKFLLSLSLVVFLSGLVFAKSNIPELNKGYVYAVYKIELKNDINRDFYSKTLGYPELVDHPHTSGYYGNQKTEKALFKNIADIITYEGKDVGTVTITQLPKDSDNVAVTSGLSMKLFGTKFEVNLPVAKTKKPKDADHRVDYNTVAFDKSCKYVYLGTFVYDFVDGTIYPKLVKVIDEYDEALEWLKEEAGKKATMSRGEIE